MSSVVERWNRILALRVSLNREILKNKYHHLPVLDSRSNFLQAGSGAVTSDACGSWHGVRVCDNVEGHEGKVLDGEDATGKYVARHKHWFCDSPLCPKCFLRGFAVFRARVVEARIKEGERLGFGKAHHIVVSPPECDRDLPEAELRKRCAKALFSRGVVGFCMIFHGRRMNKERTGLVWSEHMHTLGFMVDDYDRCRNCKDKVCLRDASGHNFDKCDGFEARTRREFEKDGYIVKVEDARKTIFGTSWYILNHVSVKVGLKRFHAVTWWGKCSNKQFKTPSVVAEVVCPLCAEEMKDDKFYVGKRRLVKDIGDRDYKAVFLVAPFDADGSANFVDVVRGEGSHG